MSYKSRFNTVTNVSWLSKWSRTTCSVSSEIRDIVYLAWKTHHMFLCGNPDRRRTSYYILSNSRFWLVALGSSSGNSQSGSCLVYEASGANIKTGTAKVRKCIEAKKPEKLKHRNIYSSGGAVRVERSKIFPL